jgi:hypothetical protein
MKQLNACLTLFYLFTASYVTAQCTGDTYLVGHAPIMQSITNGYLSTSRAASKIKFTAAAGYAFVSHPGSYTCNACGNFSLAPTGTNNSCGSAATTLYTSVLPIIISSFYRRISDKKMDIIAGVDNTEPAMHTELEVSTDGRQFTSSTYKPIERNMGYSTTYTFSLPLEEGNKFLRFRISDGRQYLSSWIIVPVGAPGKEEVSIFPNPAGSTFYAQLPVKHQFTDIAILNQTGQLVHHKNITAQNGTIKYDLPSHLQAGVYFVKISGGTKSSIVRLVKQ